MRTPFHSRSFRKVCESGQIASHARGRRARAREAARRFAGRIRVLLSLGWAIRLLEGFLASPLAWALAAAYQGYKGLVGDSDRLMIFMDGAFALFFLDVGFNVLRSNDRKREEVAQKAKLRAEIMERYENGDTCPMILPDSAGGAVAEALAEQARLEQQIHEADWRTRRDQRRGKG